LQRADIADIRAGNLRRHEWDAFDDRADSQAFGNECSDHDHANTILQAAPACQIGSYLFWS
jgi:hypothetical protein